MQHSDSKYIPLKQRTIRVEARHPFTTSEEHTEVLQRVFQQASPNIRQQCLDLHNPALLFNFCRDIREVAAVNNALLNLAPTGFDEPKLTQFLR